MSIQSYLIDTNILIGLEDNKLVRPVYAEFSQLTAKYKANVFVHEAARDDIARDKNQKRRAICLSKIDKFQPLKKVRNLSEQDLTDEFGRIKKPNDLVDTTLLHAISIGAVDFLVTEDKGIHDRARKHSADLARRVLFLPDATELLKTTYEDKPTPIRHVEETSAYTIDVQSPFFDSLRDGYSKFNSWWSEKCVKERRSCWVVYDDQELAGLIVRKDESAEDTDATIKLPKILKICTFKVSPFNRGVKLGELLLKQVLWYAQTNNYDSTYLTAYPEQIALLSLLEFYGFYRTKEADDGELTYERCFEKNQLTIAENGITAFDLHRLNYPRFVASGVRGFRVPIQRDYHNTLFPDIQDDLQLSIFSVSDTPSKPGNTIRKVYLCRANSNLGSPGSILLFYKSKSKALTSQALTAIGILESVAMANSTQELTRLAGGRSVYSEKDLIAFDATPNNPVKVINFLLAGYINPPIQLGEMQEIGLSIPQSISELESESLEKIFQKTNLGYKI